MTRTKTRAFSFLIAAAMLLSLVPVFTIPVKAEEIPTVTIPFTGSTVLTKTAVKAAVEAAGLTTDTVTNIVIESGVTEIANQAFQYCTALTSITIPNSVKIINGYAFYNCTALTSITIPGSVDTIAKNVFSNCSSLETIIISDGFKTIGDSAFAGYTALTSVTIPDSVETIGDYAFAGCSALTSITIPDSVETIGRDAFSNCSALTSINIPNGVTSIGNSAFQNCSALTSITIPGSVDTIGVNAFNGCSALTSVTISEGVPSIGDKVFYSCSGLTSITIPNSVKTIGNDVFQFCNKITSIYINRCEQGDLVWSQLYAYSSKIIWFGEAPTITIPFTGETTLTNAMVTAAGITTGTVVNVIIESGFTSIVDETFRNFSKIISVAIPDSVNTIGNSAFESCSKLASITIPEGVISIGDRAFQNCTALTSINIPEGVNRIGDYAFYGCSVLTSINIPEGVTSIGNYAFDSCTALTSINIPEGVTSIGDYAFNRCVNLTTVSLPTTITTISYSAFSGCTNLLTFNMYKSSLSNLSWDSLNAYQYIDKIVWRDPISTITIPFTGATTLTDSTVLSYLKSKAINDNIVIEEGFTVIGTSAFNGFSALTSITIPGSVTLIGTGVFNNCSSLSTINIYRDEQGDLNWSGITTYIGKIVWLGSPPPAVFLVNINGSGELTSAIAEAAGVDETTTDVEISSGFTKIKSGAFNKAKGLKKISIPKTVRHIESNVFDTNAPIEEIKMDETATDINWSEQSQFVSQIVFMSFGSPVYVEANAGILQVEATILQTVIDVVIPLNTTVTINPNVDGLEVISTGYSIQSNNRCPLGVELMSIELHDGNGYTIVGPNDKDWNKLKTSDLYIAVGLELDEAADNSKFLTSVMNGTEIWANEITGGIELGELKALSTVTFDIDAFHAYSVDEQRTFNFDVNLKIYLI